MRMIITTRTKTTRTPLIPTTIVVDTAEPSPDETSSLTSELPSSATCSAALQPGLSSLKMFSVSSSGQLSTDFAFATHTPGQSLGRV